jgi:hypothetical protein
MRFLLKFMLILVLILAATLVPVYDSRLAFPREAGPILDARVRTNHLKAIEENRPQVVLLGDSTLGASVDPTQLGELTEKSMYSISIPGSASALWYLVLKNNIAEAAYKPEYMLVVFRDTILTAPGYRVHGSYFDLVDEYAHPNDHLLMQNSFVGLMNPLEVMAEKYFPLYVARTDIRKGIDSKIRYFAPAVTGCNVDCTDYALGEVFMGADLEPGALMDAVGAAESYLYTFDQFDFERQVGRSYLPEMVQIANENNIKLVLVRIKVETHGRDPKLETYMNSLKNYVHENNVFLLDYGNDPRLTHDLFSDPMHLNPEGEIIFTQMVADGFNELFAESR